MKTENYKIKVEKIITELKDMDVDGETLQYILEELGMDEWCQEAISNKNKTNE